MIPPRIILYRELAVFAWGTCSVFFVLVSVLAKINCIVNARRGIPYRPSGLTLVGPLYFILPAAVYLALTWKEVYRGSDILIFWGLIVLVDFLVAPRVYRSAIRTLFERLF